MSCCIKKIKLKKNARNLKKNVITSGTPQRRGGGEERKEDEEEEEG